MKKKILTIAVMGLVAGVCVAVKGSVANSTESSAQAKVESSYQPARFAVQCNGYSKREYQPKKVSTKRIGAAKKTMGLEN